MKTTLTLLLTSYLIFSTTVSNAYDTRPVKSGDIVPFDGVLFSREDAQKLSTELKLADINKALVKKQEEIITLQDLQINMQRDQISLLRVDTDRLAERLQKTTSVSSWEKAAWFGAGIIVTGLAVKGASELLNK
jgi:hypothetical protein